MKHIDGRPYYYPANINKNFGADPHDVVQLALGEDLIVQVERPTGTAVTRIEVYDGDGNHIATMGAARYGKDALKILPAMIPVIQGLYPSHVHTAEEET